MDFDLNSWVSGQGGGLVSKSQVVDTSPMSIGFPVLGCLHAVVRERSTTPLCPATLKSLEHQGLQF